MLVFKAHTHRSLYFNIVIKIKNTYVKDHCSQKICTV